MKKALEILEDIVPDFKDKTFGQPKEDTEFRHALYLRLWTVAYDFDANRSRMIDISKILADNFSRFVAEVEGSASLASPARSSYIQDLIALEEKVRIEGEELNFLLRVLEGTTIRNAFAGAFAF